MDYEALMKFMGGNPIYLESSKVLLNIVRENGTVKLAIDIFQNTNDYEKVFSLMEQSDVDFLEIPSTDLKCNILRIDKKVEISFVSIQPFEE